MNEDNRKGVDYDPEGLSEDEIAILDGGEDEGPEETPAPEAEQPEVSAETPPETAKEAPEGTKNPAADPARPDGFVPLQALKAEREKAKALETELAEFRNWQRQIAERLTAARQEQAQPEEPQVPDWDNDPFARMQHVEKRLDKYEEARKQEAQAKEQENQWVQFERDVEREFNETAQTDPDLPDAWAFINHALQHEFRTIHSRTGIEWKDFQRQSIRNHMAYARQNRIPIGEYVKTIAQTRMWRPGLMREMQAKAQQGQQQPAQAQRPANNAATAKIDALAKAQETNKTLGKGTSGGGGEMTLESLEAMSGAELEKFAARNPELFERLTGIA